jgi:hypothetical protein
MAREASVDYTVGRTVPVPVPIRHRPKLIRVKAVLDGGSTARYYKLMDESPVRQLHPITVENVAHRRASELVLAQTFQDGVTRPPGKLAQLVQVVRETLRDARLIQLHEVPPTALRK